MSNDCITSYVRRHEERLQFLVGMWNDPQVQHYNDKDMPNFKERSALGSLFLAGPTSRNQILEYNWRCEAWWYLRTAGFSGIIYVPEPRGEERADDVTEKDQIHQWETRRLLDTDCVVFWIPRNTDELLGLNTNLELGMCLGECFYVSHRHKSYFIGWPDDAVRMGLPRHYASSFGVKQIYNELKLLCEAATKLF